MAVVANNELERLLLDKEDEDTDAETTGGQAPASATCTEISSGGSSGLSSSGLPGEGQPEESGAGALSQPPPSSQSELGAGALSSDFDFDLCAPSGFSVQTSVEKAKLRHPLVSHLGYMEMERQCQEEFLLNLAPGENSLDRFIATPKKCDNSYVEHDIEQGLNIYVHQDTQGGKTTGMEYMSITGALDGKMLPIIIVMDRTDAATSFRDDTLDLNAMMKDICDIAKIEDTPELAVTILESATWQNYVSQAKAWLKNPSERIPVLVLLANSAKLKLLVDEVIPRISKLVTKEEAKKKNKELEAAARTATFADGGKAAKAACVPWVENLTPKRDKNGNAPILLLVDEADQLFKTPTRTSVTEKTVWKKVDLGDQVKTSLFACVSTVAWVTATQTAVLANLVPEVDIPALTGKVIQPSLSAYNFQYRQRMGNTNREILRKYVIREEDAEKYMEGTHIIEHPDKENYIPVVDTIISCEKYRALLISCPRFHTGGDRDQAARELSRSLVCDDDNNKGVVVFSWSHNQLLFWSASTKIKAAIKALGIDKSPKIELHLSEYKTRVKNSYRAVLKELNKQVKKLCPELVLKIVVFANQMAERSVSVKGADHCLPITDLFVDGTSTNLDGLQQKLGRLCGSVSFDSGDRILWSTPYIHVQHEQGLDNTDTFVNVVKRGKSIPGAFRDLIEEAENSPSNGTLCDSDGLMAASSWKNSRKRAVETCMELKQGVRKEVKRKKLTLKKSSVANVDEEDMLDFDFLGTDILEAEAAIMGSVCESVVEPGLTEESVGQETGGDRVSTGRMIGPPQLGDLIEAIRMQTVVKFGPMTKEDMVKAFAGDDELPSITLATVEHLANHEDLKKAGIEFCLREGDTLPMFWQIEEKGDGSAGRSVAGETVCDPEPDIPYLMQYKLSLLVGLMKEVLDATYLADSEGVSVATMANEIAGKSSYPDTGEETRAPAVVRHIGQEKTAVLEASGIVFHVAGPKKIGRFYLK